MGLYVYHGPFSGTVNAEDWDARLLDYTTNPFVAVGDQDGDGISEVAIGSAGDRSWPYAAGLSGSVYLFSGPVSGELSVEDAVAGLGLDGLIYPKLI